MWVFTALLALGLISEISGADVVKKAYKPLHVAIRPEALNRRGTIGPGRTCPPGQYALGFKIKVRAK